MDKLPSANAANVIKASKSHFAHHGIPEQFIFDNGPQYISDEFKIFERGWDFQHKPVDPYNCQVNGKVEPAVKKAKKIPRKSKKSNSDAFLALLDRCNTPMQYPDARYWFKSSPATNESMNQNHSAYSSQFQPRSIKPEQERGKENWQSKQSITIEMHMISHL